MLVRRAVVGLVVLILVSNSPRLAAQGPEGLTHILTAVVPAHLAVGYHQDSARPDRAPLLRSTTNIASLKNQASGTARLELLRDDGGESQSGTRRPDAPASATLSPRVVRYTIVTP